MRTSRPTAAELTARIVRLLAVGAAAVLTGAALLVPAQHAVPAHTAAGADVPGDLIWG